MTLRWHHLVLFTLTACVSTTHTQESFQAQRDAMVREQIEARGVKDRRVLEALRRVPRERFVIPGSEPLAYTDAPLTIGHGQTISQPYIVGVMTEAAALEAGDVVLEIGTGSGYQAAILSKVARLVYTVERYRTLMKEAEGRFKQLGLTNIIMRFGDGGDGWPEQAPFDRIMVTAAAPDEPKALLAQLKPAGILVAPIGKGPVQILRRYTGDGQGGFTVEDLIEVRFVPLLDGVAREL